MDASRFAHRGNALRHGRVSEPNRAYLLTSVTYNRQALFQDWRLARMVVAEMRCLHEQQAARSLA